MEAVRDMPKTMEKTGWPAMGTSANSADRKPHKMKDALRIAVLKAMGRHGHVWSQSPGDVPCIGFVPQCQNCFLCADEGGADDLCICGDLPELSLDLFAEIRKGMTQAEREDYIEYLIDAIEADIPETADMAVVDLIPYLLDATVEQHAQAFLKITPRLKLKGKGEK